MSVDEERPTTPIGVAGAGAWADVTAHGSVRPRGGGDELAWWVAAEDRWHDPAAERVRQHRIGGTPCVETRLRVPGGDVVQRAVAVAGHGGIAVLEFTNESSRSLAIALSKRGLLTTRPPSEVGPQGPGAPSDALVFPLGHAATMRVGLARDGQAGRLPDALPPVAAVVRGWQAHTERASRLVLPDERWQEAVVRARCDVMLDATIDAGDDVATYVLSVAELVRLGEPASPFVPDAAAAGERLMKSARRCGLDWDGDVALQALARLLGAVGEWAAVADVIAARRRLGAGGAPAPASRPPGVRMVPWVEQQLAIGRDDGSCTILPAGLPPAWRGANFEVHGVPAGPRSSISYAVRWHGERPALLWEVTGEPLVLDARAIDPGWRSADHLGETLLLR
jgi:hypothetical protein